MKKTAILLALCLLPLRALALCDSWSTTDTVLASAYTGLLYLDWHQTKEFTGPNRLQAWEETNPVLGPHPSGTAVDQGAFSALVGALIVGCLLPEYYRPMLFSTLVGIELYAVDSNNHYGFHGGFALHF